jgi:hypothetical protein
MNQLAGNLPVPIRTPGIPLVIPLPVLKRVKKTCTPPNYSNDLAQPTTGLLINYNEMPPIAVLALYLKD